MNNIYLLAGASGSGKTTIQSILQKQYGLVPVISYTTRKRRNKNENNHIFITPKEFSQLNNLAAYTKYMDKLLNYLIAKIL